VTRNAAIFSREEHVPDLRAQQIDPTARGDIGVAHAFNHYGQMMEYFANERNCAPSLSGKDKLIADTDKDIKLSLGIVVYLEH
jgi:hypothetical protein